MAIKITKTKKQPVKASSRAIKNCSTSNISANPQPIEGNEEICEYCGEPIEDCVCECDNAETCICDAKSYIQSAISALSTCAKDNDLVKDCIANLGVVLLDLSLTREGDVAEEPVEEVVEEIIETPVEELV